MTAAAHFSATVGEAEQKFSNACRQHNVPVRSFAHRAKGPDGEALTLGVCRVGPTDAANRLLIISATHGVEGFAGAAIQTGWLQQFGGSPLPKNTCVVMVHMLNPWGMAWNRRENEDNVDVFRNLIYCDDPSDADPLFDVVDDLLDLEHWPERDLVSWQELAAPLIAEHGSERLLCAIRRGQHHRPQSMTFHGNGPSWSKRRLDDIVIEYLQGAARIAVIDIHTGFGEYGNGIVMSYDPAGSDNHRRISEWFSGDIYTPGSDANIPQHDVRLPFAWIETLVSSSCVTAEILEFGTFDPAEIGEIFNANHHYHIYGDALSADGLKWGRSYRRYCYPEEKEWNARVYARGQDVIQTTLAGLVDWSFRDAA